MNIYIYIYIYIYVRTRNIKNWFRGFKLRNAPLQSTKLVLKMKKEEKKKQLRPSLIP